MILDKNPEKIKEMFNKIANKYDFINNLISFYTHKIFKYQALKSLEIKNEHKILDLCCGTGDISRIIKKMSPKTQVTGVDFSSDMLKIAKSKCNKIEYIEADATELPFLDNTFDTVVIGFGLRNIENIDKALDEIYRVLKNNGQFLHLDFEGRSRFSFVYDFLILFLISFFVKNAEPYKYLIKSKKSFYTSEELIKKFKSKNFSCAKCKKSFLGIVAFQVMKKNY